MESMVFIIQTKIKEYRNREKKEATPFEVDSLQSLPFKIASYF